MQNITESSDQTGSSFFFVLFLTDLSMGSTQLKLTHRSVDVKANLIPVGYPDKGLGSRQCLGMVTRLDVKIGIACKFLKFIEAFTSRSLTRL